MTSEDLLAKLTVLHNYIERELQGVVTAVSHLDFKERPTRKLHSILTLAQKRIQTALAQQRMLLWNFSMESNPAAGCVHSAESDKVKPRKGRRNGLEELAVGSRTPQNCGTQTCAACRGDKGAKGNRELEWKRDTLVRMKYLLQRKAGDHTATEADRTALQKDIAKITLTLGQLQASGEQHQKCTCVTTTAAEEGYSCNKNAGAMDVEHDRTSARSTCRPGEWARAGANTACASGTATPCSRVARGQHGKGVPKKNVCFDQSALKVELRFPDGLDLLLRRIAEGVRPPIHPAAASRLPSSELPSTSGSTHRGEQTNEDGEDGNNRGSTSGSLTGAVDPPCAFFGAGKKENGGGGGGGGGAVQAKAAPAALSNLVGGTNDRRGEGCGGIQRTSRNAASGEYRAQCIERGTTKFEKRPRLPTVADTAGAEAQGSMQQRGEGGAQNRNTLSVLRRGGAEARANRALCTASMAPAVLHGPKKTSGPSFPSGSFGGWTSGSRHDKENQPGGPSEIL